MKYKISVLIPVYNVEQYIEKCAESLFKNTIANECEFIFTNDGSTDSSIQKLNTVIEKFPELKNNIVVLQHEKNMGLGATRNTGFDNAKGKYIICTDSDDWVEPDYLEKLFETAEKDDLDLVGCDAFFENEKNGKTEIVHYPLNKDPKQCLNDIYYEKVGSYLWIKLLKRDFLISNNIRWADDVSMFEDVLLTTKILSKNPKIGYVNKALYHYLLRQGSYIHSLYSLQKTDSIFVFIKYLSDYVNDNKLDYTKDSLNTFIYCTKYYCISHGTIKTQKKYLNVYKNINHYGNRKNTKLIYYIALKISTKNIKLAFIIIYVYTLIKCLLGKTNYKEYISN